MVLAWVVGGATLWVVAGTATAFLVAAVLGRSGDPCARAAAVTAPVAVRPGAVALVPTQRSASPTGPHALPPCCGIGRTPSRH